MTGPAAGRVTGAESGQYRFRSKGYVGNTTRWRRALALNRCQSTVAPAIQSRPTLSSRTRNSGCRLEGNDARTGCSADRDGCCRASVDRVWPGPTSNRTLRGCFINSATLSAKRTVWRTWLAQYSGALASAAVIQLAVTLDK